MGAETKDEQDKIMSIRSILTALAFLLFAPLAVAQGSFSPSITVNDRVITGYELDQRAKLLELFRTPGNPRDVAREQLIEDRLKQQAMDAAGISLSADLLASEVEAFAGRANLTTDQFVTILNQNGVEKASLEEFVRMGITWRDYIRARFGSQAQISEADIDRAIAQTGDASTGIEVLLSEIIIAAPPPRAAQAMARAEQISQIRSFAAFEAQARQVSALPSRVRGGRLNWLPISNYPPALRSILLELSPGEVTAPLSITNGVALFQMRDVREIPQAAPVPTSVEYAAYYIGGDNSLGSAQDVAARVDTCDDLYGIARNQPAEVLERDSLAPGDIPQDVAIELAKLDPGEVSYNLLRADGQTRVFLMLCNRGFADDATVDRDAVRTQLRGQRLGGLADSLLEDLKAAATING